MPCDGSAAIPAAFKLPAPFSQRVLPADHAQLAVLHTLPHGPLTDVFRSLTFNRIIGTFGFRPPSLSLFSVSFLCFSSSAAVFPPSRTPL